MKLKHHALLMLAAFAGFSLVGANATEIFTENFENPVVTTATGYTNVMPTGWTGAGGINTEASGQFTTNAGEQAFWTNSAVGSMTTSAILSETLTVGVTYTLDVEVGKRSGLSGGDYNISLLAGTTLLANVTGSPITSDFSESAQIIFTPDVTHAGLLGETLQINLATNGAHQPHFDNVVLDATASGTDDIPPVIDTLSPGNADTGVAVDADLVITFNEDVQKGGSGNIVIKNSGGTPVQTINVTTAAVTVTDNLVTIDLPSDLADSTGYYVEITPGAIKDLALPSTNNFGGISGSGTWSFTTSSFIPITVANHSFEDGADGSGTINQAPWQKAETGSNIIPIQELTLLGTSVSPAPDGTDTTHYTNSISDSIYQVLVTSLAANTTYTLRVDVGDRTNTTAQPGSILLGYVSTTPTDDDYGLNLLTDTVIISNTVPEKTSTESTDGWETWVSTFTTGASPAGLGQPLRIELVTAGATQTLWDNVRLTYAPPTGGGSAYDTWADLNGLTGANDGPNDDPEGDGAENTLEWILGGAPLAQDAASILPAAEGDTGTGLTLTFTREEDSIAETTLLVQWNTDLSSTWNDVTIGATSSGPDGNGVVVTIDTGLNPDGVTVNIPASNAASGKIFARLDASQP